MLFTPLTSFRRQPSAIIGLIVLILGLLANCASAATKIRNGADPTVLKIDNVWYSAESAGGGVWVREASSIVGLGDANVIRTKVWSDTAGRGDVWAPEITKEGSKTYIYFTAGKSAAHRMYVISADTPRGTYSKELQLNLAGDTFAIDGAYFKFEGQGWFVWSGQPDSSNSEQNLYISKMNSPIEATGERYIISQPREPWEQTGAERINEGPEVIVDPNGQLHIVYSSNASWMSKYCLADLRLRKGGNPTNVWDWYKSNGCLFGSHQEWMMNGWDATLQVDGPGHHTFALPNGDINQSPGGTSRIPFVFHAVSKGTPYSWEARAWFSGSFVWWSQTTYSRGNSPGPATDTGYSFKFFE